MLQDYKHGLRMLLKFPGLTIAGGLALAVAIGLGAGWYDLAGKIMFPTIPLPEGDRIVLIETRNTLTNAPELRVAHDLLEWRRQMRTVQELGANRGAVRNLVVGNAPPVSIQTAELTAAAFRAARVPPIVGRGLLDSDDAPGAPNVVVLGYDVWQRALGGRPDIVGTAVTMGQVPATVIGVMPKGFGYPLNYAAWMPLHLRASYAPLEGGPIGVIGRLSPGATLEQANAELQLMGEHAAATLAETHTHLRSLVTPLGAQSDLSDITELAIMFLPALLGLIVACTTVGTLIYARTAIREGEIALRTALGASRARIVGQLFIETLALSLVAVVVGLAAADRALKWGFEGVAVSQGGVPFWITPELTPTTIVYAFGLGIVGAGLLSILPALRVTRARVQPHLANLGGSATLRFGRVWTTAMIAQVALTAIAIPVAIEGTSEAMRNVRIRSEFPSEQYLSARLEWDGPVDAASTPASAERRAQVYAAFERRLEREPGVIAVTFADRVPGGSAPVERVAGIETSPGSGDAFTSLVRTSEVGPGFFEAFERPIVAGRRFNAADFGSSARTVIVNEAFARMVRQRGGFGSPVGARVRYFDRPTAPGSVRFDIVGVVRDFGLDPDDDGAEVPYVFQPASPGTRAALAVSVHVGGNPAPLVARLPAIASDADAGLSVNEARSLDEWIWRRDLSTIVPVGALAAVDALVLLLSAMGIFSLMSVSVSRRTREIGLRAALGATGRDVISGIVRRAIVLMGCGIMVGSAVVLLSVALGAGPTGRVRNDVMTFVGWLGITAIVMLVACVLACVAPARRALKINPIAALREV